ncbi:MAG: GTP diphosphokinase [Succinivibrionaceae bacterium]|jgi:GTP pyrophosphokinase|nr:GTP diphosphokinase [Succinivibrionaceae bacterium]
MVAIRDTHSKKKFDLDVWINSLHQINESDRTVLVDTFNYCTKLSDDPNVTHKLQSRSAEMIGILLTIHMDLATLQVAILYNYYTENLLSISRVEEDFPKLIVSIMKGAIDMEAIRFLQNMGDEVTDNQIDNVRRMLIAMVEDIRAVVIKLSERIAYLREVKNADEETRVLTAKEISAIYAPLANRLGIGQLKWELEDLSFRYLHPDIYRQIAKQLDEKRIDREEYINNFVQELKELLKHAGIEAEVYGRPKHIYSIWRKMQKKNLDFSELYDVRAVRIITQELSDCYAALGVVHTHWHHIPKEFDDYVANPKPNGYQSIHTVVLGDGGKPVEIQIRTEKMHQNAELGVAAHWKYKENSKSNDTAYEERIAWLRHLLSWQEDMVESGTLVDEFRTQVFEDRVYLFTPKGDVVDLPAGATPLDMAYSIHTNIGHRCIGAKVNGKIVPFTYQLQTGEQVEILTQKEPNPSRDWLNPNNGYLKTSKARSKVAAWFKRLDREKNLIAGREIFERELERNGVILDKEKLQKYLVQACQRHNLVNVDDLMVNIGSGVIKINQLISFLELGNKTAADEDQSILERFEKNSVLSNSGEKAKSSNNIIINGVGNLLIHLCKNCCPVPGDDITGFITQGRGVTIHRLDCSKLADQKKKSPERIVEASWAVSYSQGYTITVRITASDRPGLLRDITTVIANEKVNVLGIQSKSNVKTQTANIDINMEVYNISALTRIISKLNQVDNVISAKRL